MLAERVRKAATARGQQPGDFVRWLLEASLEPAVTWSGRSPKQILTEFFAANPRREPADLIAVAREQGTDPLTLRSLVADGPAEGDDFDVDGFLEARDSWQWEGRLPGEGLVGPHDASK